MVTSVYDTKPVNYLSMVWSGFKWIVTEKDVFNLYIGITETLYFLWISIIHYNNFSIGIVEVVYQMRGTYRFDHWSRKRKL